MSGPSRPASLLDAGTPGGVYLCQVSEGVSCGACCGLYNLADCSRDNLAQLLRTRSLRFAGVPRTVEAIENFAHQTLRREPQQRPFEGFHHCPFLGWIEDGPGRVGCLLHPLAEANRGVDYRGLSYYGGLACRSYFCPTTHALSPRFKEIVRSTAADWYAYGLVITEQELLEEIFRMIELRLQHRLGPASFSGLPAARQALTDLLGLKIDWPFRPPYWNTPCHYFFKENRRPKPPIDYQRLGAPPSVFDSLLRELVSDFSSLDRLRLAEQMLERALQHVVRELQRTPAGENL